MYFLGTIPLKLNSFAIQLRKNNILDNNISAVIKYYIDKRSINGTIEQAQYLRRQCYDIQVIHLEMMARKNNEINSDKPDDIVLDNTFHLLDHHKHQLIH